TRSRDQGANDAGARERLPAFHEISPDVGMITNDHQWKTFVFVGYGMRSACNLARCPRTAQALLRISGLPKAFLSPFSNPERASPCSVARTMACCACIWP
uniref:aspartyl/asparaginyl beta-hydroxylase domain-containing protein n=1 Tax=Streptomyces clavuligerus TaxID=1901 RepID=UPI0018D0D857